MPSWTSSSLRWISRSASVAVAGLFVVLMEGDPDALAGDVVGRAHDFFDETVGIRGADVIVEQGAKRKSTTSEDDGKFTFTDVPDGPAIVSANSTTYDFLTESIDVSKNEPSEVKLLGMNRSDTRRIATYVGYDARLFSDLNVGYKAAWSQIAQFNMPLQVRVQICREIVDKEPAASEVQAIREYAEANVEAIKRAEREFVDFLRQINTGFPDFDRDAVGDGMVLDIMQFAHNGEFHGKLETPARERWDRLLTGLGERCGKELEDRAVQNIHTGSVVRRLRRSTWEGTRDRGREAQRCRVELNGSTGTFQIADGRDGRLDHIHYFPNEEQIAIQGFWRVKNEVGWFAWNVDPKKLGEFRGGWGVGDKIGQGNARGDWDGARRNR